MFDDRPNTRSSLQVNVKKFGTTGIDSPTRTNQGKARRYDQAMNFKT